MPNFFPASFPWVERMEKSGIVMIERKKSGEGCCFMEDILNRAYEEGTRVAHSGNVASYIPELEKGNPEDVGFVIMDLKGNAKARGQYLKSFTLQSITKVITLLLALEDIGEEEVFQ